MEVRSIEPEDEAVLGEFCEVWHASDVDDWPGYPAFTASDLRAFAAHVGTTRRFHLYAAVDPGGPMVGAALMEVPLRDNLHSVEITVNVHPDRRRRGTATALVEHMAARAEDDGRRALNTIVDVPLAKSSSHPSTHFARRVGFAPTLAGNLRHLALPLDPGRVTELRQSVTNAKGADGYRTFTFTTPWPEEYTEDHCELGRRMSTDEPPGDSSHEEEVWDARRVLDNDALDAAQGTTRLAAVAQHLESGRLIAFSELLLSPDRPAEAWQMATLVHPEHRGHRLGLAVKLANLEYLAAASSEVRLVITGNAQVNAPMIAINDMLGFEVVAEQTFWQKSLRPS